MSQKKNIHDEIARVAYELYEKRGRAHGHELEDWSEAERIVMERHERHAKEIEHGVDVIEKVKKGFGETVKKGGREPFLFFHKVHTQPLQSRREYSFSVTFSSLLFLIIYYSLKIYTFWVEQVTPKIRRGSKPPLQETAEAYPMSPRLTCYAIFLIRY